MPWLTGIPRDKVNWGPTIDESRCIGCGMCLNCGKKVFEWKEGRSTVARFYDCQVGCNTCGNLCPGNAISFPDLKELRDLYAREKIWAKVKEEMKKEGKITD